MAVHRITKGLDLPISGAPMQIIRGREDVSRVAVMADDFPGVKPGMEVRVDDVVKRGQALFTDRRTPGVLHTAPGAGKVIAVHRGARRVLQSVVIELSEGERSGREEQAECVTFERYSGRSASDLSREDIVGLLVESGQWSALRTRPFSKVPRPETTPRSIFVTATDTNPLAPLPEVVIETRRDDFDRGLEIVAKLTDGPCYLCIREGSGVADGITAPVTVEEFSGPHPAGTAGLHIHRLDAVSREKVVWHLGYQDVIAIGSLFATGRLDIERVISIAGPACSDPRLIATRLGASVAELVGDDATDDTRCISGSVLSGKKAMGEEFGYMGRFDRQISLLREGRERIFMGWLTPGMKSFSTIPIYLSRLFGVKSFDFTTSTNGSPRSMVPIGTFERVMPMDILPTFLLRSLLVGDIEQAEKLGALELDEEDLALCTFVCSGKTDYGPVLRRNLSMIEKEG
ncbi:MAG: Na(+)-translocating NADH-quinone reductase subunit A [Deltaproteobacteria bacterium]|nr:Na(+)-translocating NADH-quinone reductase subunit A [Deltaproteobacteria bacterium]MBW2664734.1 Na(+)-translocating NADH-quinone reductase subunit A [Deltaproteobacteria bacterium]